MIIAVVMAGGKGERLKSEIEKPLFPFKEVPLIDYVLNSLRESKLVDKIVVAVSSNTPNTKEYMIQKGMKNYNDQFNQINKSICNFCDDNKPSFYLDSPAKGFVEDLSFILSLFESRSKEDVLLFINADLPLVNVEIIDYILNYYFNQNKSALSVFVPVEIFKENGIDYSYEFDGNVPSGINILRSENVIQEEELLIISRYELAFNVNTIEVIERLS